MILCCRKEFLFIKEAGFGGQGGVQGVLLVSSLLQLHLCWAAVKLTMSYWSISSWSHERHVNCWSNCILSNASKSICQPWWLLIAQMSIIYSHIHQGKIIILQSLTIIQLKLSITLSCSNSSPLFAWTKNSLSQFCVLIQILSTAHVLCHYRIWCRCVI